MLPISQTMQNIYTRINAKASLKYYEGRLVAITCGEAATGLGGVAIGSSGAPALVSTRKINALAEAWIP